MKETMSSLKEKAIYTEKRYCETCDSWTETPSTYCKQCGSKLTYSPQKCSTDLIRLEDAQQEIENQESKIVGENEDILIQMWLDEIDANRQERLELKQKLDELLSCFRGWWRVYQHYLPSASTARSDFESHLAKFEELLK